MLPIADVDCLSMITIYYSTWYFTLSVFVSGMAVTIVADCSLKLCG